ncbi:MAG: glycosyltransferase [Tahibacter sp.]
MASMPELLYISYNGIDEPLVESQVLNYLRGLVPLGFRFTLLTFERHSPEPAETARIRARLAADGIDWQWLIASRGLGPASTALDILRGSKVARRLAQSRRFGLTHARSFIPALIAYRLKRQRGLPFINDLRGFWVDEKVYRRRMRGNGWLYQIGKWLEARVLRGSDFIVSLTDRGQHALRAFPIWKGYCIPPMTTIPTCVDLHRFDASPRPQKTFFVFGYVGSLSAEYLPDQIMAYFAAALARFPGSRLHLITRSNAERLRALAREHALPEDSLQIVAVAPDRVAEAIAQFDVGLSFIRPHFSKIASCPTKIGEYLAAGIPVVSNAGIGDLDALLQDSTIGYVLRTFDADSFDASFRHLQTITATTDLSAQCRHVASQQFSLALGIQRYAEVYRSVLKDQRTHV